MCSFFVQNSNQPLVAVRNGDTMKRILVCLAIFFGACSGNKDIDTAIKCPSDDPATAKICESMKTCKSPDRSEAEACQRAGLTNPHWTMIARDPRWPREGIYSFRCVAANGVIHEVVPPACNARPQH